MKQIVIYLLVWSTITTNVIAQQSDFYGNKPEDVCIDDMSFKSDAEVEQLVTSICEQAGFKNRYIIKSCGTVENCMAKVFKGKPYILYNAQYLLPVRQLNFTYSSELPKITDQEKWKILGVLSHEIGHHINMHLINPPEGLSQITMELEADQFSGRSLYMLGATLEQALLAYEGLPLQGNGYTHPSREQRIAAVTKGYNDCKDKFPNQKIDEADKTVLQQLQLAREYMSYEEYAKAFSIYYKYCMHNLFSLDDMNNLGDLYENGLGVNQNYTEAMKWYRKAAERGLDAAQNNLGFMYDNGEGILPNDAEAIKWYRKAAEQGHFVPQYNLGAKYDDLENYTEAFKWYLKSAQQGYDIAQNFLGLMYEEGKGVSQNYPEAVKWYRKSAEQGNSQAQNNLGMMYDEGIGVEQNDAEALKWYRKSAEQGCGAAQFNLGYVYENALLGLNRDMKKAISYYQQAARNGNADAKEVLKDKGLSW